MPYVGSCDVMWCHVRSCDSMWCHVWDHVTMWCHMWDHVMSCDAMCEIMWCDVCHHMTSHQHFMSVCVFDVPFFSHRVTYPMKMSCFWTMESRYIEWCGYNNITIVQSYTGSLLPSVLLWLCNTSNNANDNKLVIFLSLVVMILSYEPLVLLHVQT